MDLEDVLGLILFVVHIPKPHKKIQWSWQKLAQGFVSSSAAHPQKADSGHGPDLQDLAFRIDVSWILVLLKPACIEMLPRIGNIKY